MLSAQVIVGHGVFPAIKISNRQDTDEVTLDGQPRSMIYLSFRGVIHGKNQVFRFLPLRARYRWIY